MMKNKFMGLAVILCLVLAVGAIAHAVGQTQILQKRANPVPAPLPTADLQIKWITASPCACTAELAVANATILEGPIVVRVHNAGPQAADAMLRVRVWQHYRSIAAIIDEKRVHLEKNQSQDVVTFSYLNPQHTILVWTAGYGTAYDGIKAEIELTSAGIDPNLSNNTSAILGCQQIVE